MYNHIDVKDFGGYDLKYDLDETLNIVMERKRGLEIRNERIKLFACNLLVLLLTFGMFSFIVYRSRGAASYGSDYFGGFMLAPEMGGYILVALIAFATGICAMLAIQHYKKIQDINKK